MQPRRGPRHVEGVTVTLEDDIYTGITPQNFAEFFEDKIAARLKREGAEH